MNKSKVFRTTALSAAVAALVGSIGVANATEPCGDFGECKALVEINSSDGDIGFHFLMDGDNLIYGSLFNPDRRKIFVYWPRRELRRQTSTELFQESAEPLCYDPTTDDDEDNDDEDFVTLAEFTDRWEDGTYYFFGLNSDYEWQRGTSELTFNLPAAPIELDWDVEDDEHEPGELEYEISWEAGTDLGECSGELDELVPDVVADPATVPVAQWEVVLEVDIDEEDIESPEDQAVANSKYVVRIPGDAEELEIEVPDDFIETLPEDTPAKMEIGAIGFDDNATFSEEDEICLNDTDPDGTYDEDEDAVLNGCGFEVEVEDGED